MIRLHFAPNTIAMAAMVALEEGDVHYAALQLDFAKSDQQSTGYLAINPKGRVPSLETPQGTLTEVGAILEYIADTLVPALKPMDAWHAAKMREMMFYLGSTMHVNHAHKFRGHRWANTQSAMEDMTSKVPETMAASCAYVEDQIEGPLLFGSQPTIADCYLLPIATWLAGDGVDITDYPKLTTWFETISARPSVQAVKTKSGWI